jgi:hypothetical protein
MPTTRGLIVSETLAWVARSRSPAEIHRTITWAGTGALIVVTACGTSGRSSISSPWRSRPISRAPHFSAAWQATGALNLNTGIDNELNGQSAFSFEEPNQVLPNRYGNSRLQYLNPAAFATPALGTYGSVGVFSLTGPSFWELDTALSRIFRIGEHQSLEARWEAFNITNSMRPLVTTPGNPNNPFATLNSGTFGQVTQSYDPRIMQFAMKYVF